MVLYYIDNEIFLDFQTIKERVQFSESSLYRRIRNKCSGVRYRNKILFRCKDLVVEFPEIYKQIEDYETSVR